MKNDRDFDENIMERPMRRRQKNKKLPSVLLMFGGFLVLALVIYMAGVLYMLLDRELGKDKEEALPVAAEVKEEEITYTQADLDAKVAQAAEAARTEGILAENQRILEGLKAGLTGGDTMVEALRPFYPNDLVVVSGGTFHFVPIREDLKKNAYVEENLNILESGEIQYLENGQVISHKGIDVSKFQGDIDWKLVAEDGVEYAFLRVGNRGYGTGKLVEDESFEANITGALSAGIKVGVYIYSQAVNDAEVLEEANFVLEKIAPYKIECPVVFDVEKVTGDDGRMNALSVEERTRLTKLFCDTIAEAGYKPMIYHNMEMGVMMLDLGDLEQFDKWFAYYNPDMYYPYDYKIWQYSDKGRVNGIKKEVDLNISFTPFWEE